MGDTGDAESTAVVAVTPGGGEANWANESENCRRFKPLKAKLLKMLEANPLDFEHPPTQQEKDQPHPMFWVPDDEKDFPDENPGGINSLFLLRQIMKVRNARCA